MEILSFFSPIRIYVVLTFIVVAICYDKHRTTDLRLFQLMALTVFYEVVAHALKFMELPRHYSGTIFTIIHVFLWLNILHGISEKKKVIKIASKVYLGSSFISLILLDSSDLFRYCFILGSLLYMVIFILDSSRELKLERLTYFTSENYLLIVAPLAYFIGFSLIFAFKERQIGEVKLTSFCTLYDFISYFVNIIYYSLINLYIYKRNIRQSWSTT